MAILTREQLLGAVDVPTETVWIPELKGSVVVRGMTAKERTAFEKKFMEERRGKLKRDYTLFREYLCVYCCVDPKLTEADLDRLGQLRADVVEQIANPAMKLSGITEKDIEELGQSSEPTAAISSSSSASPASSGALSA